MKLFSKLTSHYNECRSAHTQQVPLPIGCILHCGQLIEVGQLRRIHGIVYDNFRGWVVAIVGRGTGHVDVCPHQIVYEMLFVDCDYPRLRYS